MSAREFTGRCWRDGGGVRLTVREGRIAALEPADAGKGAVWLAPALFDVQVNGFAGVDFQADDLKADDLLRAVAGLGRAGCTQFLLTLITDAWQPLVARLRHLHQLRASHPTLREAIAGWHVEGPFLSEEAGYHGAHNPRQMRDPTPERIRELRAAAGSDPLLLTLAPERAGALAAIACAVSLGIKVSLGHTNATTAQLRAAIDAGATGFTHLGNACPQALDRHDNILWRALELPGLTVSLIADGRHVSPALFRLVHRVVPADSIIYATDAMAAAGAPPGRYRLGALELEVGADRVVRQPGQTNFAGSALTPVEAVFKAAEMLGVPWQQTWDRIATGPRRWLGLAGGLEVGERADFCLVQISPDDGQLQRLRTFRAGEEIE